jgi:hypothetical protein
MPGGETFWLGDAQSKSTRISMISAIPHFDEHVSIHERQPEALFPSLRTQEFVSETVSAFQLLKSELLKKCDEISHNVRVPNSTTSESVVTQCRYLRSQLDREIENMRSWVNSELSSKCRDLPSEISRELETIKSMMS